MKIFSIGKIVNKKEQVYIELDPKYSKGLKGLEGYSSYSSNMVDKCLR